MTEKELAEIRERVEAASAGPWTAAYGPEEDRLTVIAHTPPQGHRAVAKTDVEAAADARFIAHARSDVPALLAEIERLKAEAKDRALERMEYADKD